nr:uncharacterized protein LOC111429441 [Onthophagus taurus]
MLICGNTLTLMCINKLCQVVFSLISVLIIYITSTKICYEEERRDVIIVGCLGFGTISLVFLISRLTEPPVEGIEICLLFMGFVFNAIGGFFALFATRKSALYRESVEQTGRLWIPLSKDDDLSNNKLIGTFCILTGVFMLIDVIIQLGAVTNEKYIEEET